MQLPNLSITRGAVPAGEAAPARKRNWARTIKRVVGWGSLGFLFFVLFAWIALPTKAIAWRISHEAKKAGYVIEVEDISVMPWGSATLENVTWTFAPSRPDAPPQQYFMEEIDISISLLSLLAGTYDIEVETEREDGRIWARYAQGTSETQVEVDVDGLPLYDVPKAAQALNVPMYGLLKVKADITAPEGKFSKAEGKINISCSACRAGDGESKLYVPGGSKSLRDGLTVPEVDFGTITGELVVKKGSATIEEPIATESDDLIMSLTGKLKLKDPFEKSRFSMVLKLELTEAFLESAERVAFIYRGASAKAKLDPPERGLGFKLTGPVAKPRFIGVKSKSTSETLAERRKKRRARDRKRAERKSKRNKAKKKKKTPAKVEKKDEEDEKKDEDNLNIRPLDGESNEDSEESKDDQERPALPPPDEDDEVEVFDPEGGNEPAGDQDPQPTDDERYAGDGDGQADGGGEVDDGQVDDGQGQGDDPGDGQGGQADDGQGQGDGQGRGGSGGQQE